MPNPRRMRERSEPDYVLVGYLRDGRFTAVASALAVLHGRGLVEAGRAGTVRRSEVNVTAPQDDFERLVWSAIHGFVSPGALMSRPHVDQALNDLRRRARRLGLLRWYLPVRDFLPSRTRLGRNLVDAAWRDYPWPPSPETTDTELDQRIGMAVALYGNTALTALMPDFARDSGLLDRAGKDGLDWADPEAPGPIGRYV